MSKNTARPLSPLHRASMMTEELVPPSLLEEGAFDSDVVVPSSLIEISPILRVANEIEPSNSRVAYLCRFFAFEEAHRLDPTSSGPGVRQFKTALIHRLERDNSQSLSVRGKNSDGHEMQSFYRHYTTTYVQSTMQNSADNAESCAQLTKVNQTAGVLLEVLKAMNLSESIEIENEILKFHGGELSVCDIEEKMTTTDEELPSPSPTLVAKNDE